MADAPRRNPLKHLRRSDLRGIAQLATQATTGVADIAEGLHQSVWATLGVRGPSGGAAAGRTGGVTGFVYQGVRGIAALLGGGIDRVLAGLQPLFDAADAASPDTPQREAVLAALNGVLGDRLAASGNPLATPMRLRWRGQVLAPQAMPPAEAVTGRLLLLVHGLCMNDLQWGTQHADALAAQGHTVIRLRYNTGRPVADNGHELALQLEQVLADWSVPVDGLAVLAHSMGGLVARCAVHAAAQAGLQWPARLRQLVFLGTPHHGAPLERAGHWVDVLLGSTPFSRPFAKLTQLRSAGITDLRHGLGSETEGFLSWLPLPLGEGWGEGPRSGNVPGAAPHPSPLPKGAREQERKPPTLSGLPLPLPLPAGVACYAVAATTAAKRSRLADRLVGDGLVPLRSALGQHDDPLRDLGIAPASQWVAYRTGHLALLDQPAVTAQLLRWLAPG